MIPIIRYDLNDFVDKMDLELAPDNNFYPSSPPVDIPLLRKVNTATDDQADRKKLHWSYDLETEIRKKLILEGHLREEGSDESDNESETDNLKSENIFMVPNFITINSMLSLTSWLIDSGLSGMNNRNLLSCPSTCKVPITPAFGEMITATSEGSIRDSRLGQLRIQALHVDKMHHHLLSVHQLCGGGDFRTKQIGVVTDEGCRFFPLDHCRDALKLLSSKLQTSSKTGKEWSVRIRPI